MSICTLIIAGNLGSNAESKVISGKRYTKCSVAVSTTNNQTQWIEVLKKDEEQKLIPYLTKGSKITAIGIPTFSAYVANKNGEPTPSVTLWAIQVELPRKEKDQPQEDQPQRNTVPYNNPVVNMVRDATKHDSAMFDQPTEQSETDLPI